MNVHNMLMARFRWPHWYVILYPIAGLALVNIAYQLGSSWRQAHLIAQADPVLLGVAVLNQLVAYQVVVPAMQRFYARVGLPLSSWKTFGLVALGLTAAKVVPAGEYVVWRLSFRRLKGGASATTQWLILYYVAMFGGLLVLFLVFEAATLAFYPHAQASTLVGKLRFLPVGATLAFLVALLFVRLLGVAAVIKRLAFDALGSQAVSPVSIIRERKLDGEDVSALALASLATWLVEALTLYLCLWAMGLRVPLVIAIFGFTFMRLFSFLPLVPGGIGELEAGALLFFAAYGYPVSPVFTATILYRLITYWPPMVIGLMSYIGFKGSGGSETIRFGGRQFAAELHRRQRQLPAR